MSTVPATMSSRAWRTAIARGAVYAFLARSLAYPSDVHRQALADEILPVLRGVRPSDDTLARALAAALDAYAASCDEPRGAYLALFPAVGQGELAVYETVYRTRDLFQEAEILADIAGFYRAHGLVVGALERERPDHIAVELEFMAFLARKRAHALAELGRAQVATCRATEVAFLRDHLGAWAPLLGTELARVAPHPFYRATGALLACWLASDMSAQGVEAPAPLAPPRAPAPSELVRPGEDACPIEQVVG